MRRTGEVAKEKLDAIPRLVLRCGNVNGGRGMATVEYRRGHGTLIGTRR